ncbi:hypothetical protein [Metabacillus arenae]|uniref:Uncharacterized protein n=1 Tax=Metabacillus arenae TaxID=2771434 RepID=A0A926RVM6_9BACI|nr:hypothetical protein [Metabacillus arenae]MBD1379036.1 hypothetical protein [Metabacillus arenae]
MSQDYYRLCCQHRGKVARITDRAGRTHVGRIVNVTRRKVYIQPMGPRGGGYGLGFWGGGYYPGYYYPYGIGLGFITGLVIGGLFW